MNTSNPYMLSDEQIRDLQSVLLEMLIEVERICKKNEIRYSLFYGTLLGAVRHSGFIPWDDDLDVAMLRAEYRKFRTACERDLDRSRFFLQDHASDPHYRWGWLRLRRKNSEFVRLGQEHMKMQTGIFLDVFPIDGVPNFAPLRALHCFYCFALRKILYSEVGRKSSSTKHLRVWYTLLNIIPHDWALRKIKSLSLNGDKAKYVRVLAFPLPKGKISGYPRQWFEELEYMIFEGYMFPVIKEYHNFLEFNYGNYMKLPPPENRTGGHPAAKFRLP